MLARRDDLYKLSNRALEILMAILDNPKSSPAVLLKTSMFILQRPQLPKTGWSMPEPAPNPDGNKLLNSAIIEQDYDSLPGLCNIERDFETDVAPAAESAAEPESIALRQRCTVGVHCDNCFSSRARCFLIASIWENVYSPPRYDFIPSRDSAS